MNPILPITALYPATVEVDLAGFKARIGEITIGDIVDLQRWIEGRSVGPLEALRPRLGEMAEPERKAALWGVYDALEAGPVLYGSDEANAMLRTGPGIEETTRIILRHHHPTEAADRRFLADLLDAVARVDVGQYWAMRRAWVRVDPVAEVEVLLGIDDPPGEGRIGYPEAIMQVVASTGWTLEYVASLSLTAFKHARTMGKPVERGTQVRPGSGDLETMVRQRKSRYYGRG